MHDLVLWSAKDHSPVTDSSGKPIMWIDVLAELGKQARENGYQLEIAENEDGEIMFRFVEPGEDGKPCERTS
jgi:hypothetical protein